MKRIIKIISTALLVIVILLFIAVGCIVYLLPDVGKAPAIKVAITPERVQRGEYLATSVAVCMDCHSKRNWSLYAGPITPGTYGGGGEIFDKSVGFPGTFYSRNITPYHLANWTDGDIYRVVTTGVSKDGHPLFPVMPYHYYGQVDTEDVYSIIAYIRTLPVVKNDVPASHADFPMNVIMHLIPKKATPHPKPSPSDSVAYGGYLVTMAGCVECHTKDKQGQIVKGLEFAGGREFSLSAGIVRSANITPDPATGIGSWTEDQFVSRFKMYQNPNYKPMKLAQTDFNTIMPWMMYSRMTESDLKSIYQYLRTIKKMNNKVDKFTPRA